MGIDLRGNDAPSSKQLLFRRWRDLVDSVGKRGRVHRRNAMLNCARWRETEASDDNPNRSFQIAFAIVKLGLTRQGAPLRSAYSRPLSGGTFLYRECVVIPIKPDQEEYSLEPKPNCPSFFRDSHF